MDEELREERLDSPLVVHKKDDASYQEFASEISMNATHTDEESAGTPTLERHRFKKKKKNKKWPLVLIAFIAIAVAVICALHYNGYFDKSEEETSESQRKSYVTQAVNEFEGIITVKGTYIFVEGEEVDGIKGLEKAIKYLDEGTSFIVQDENADSNFLNFDILSILSKYNIDYEIKHVVSTGLMSKYETTAPAATESTTASTTAASSAASNE